VIVLLLTVVILLIMSGALLYAINFHVPRLSRTQQILNWVIVWVVLAWVLQLFGFWGFLVSITVRGRR
jgi:hypothetical protein